MFQKELWNYSNNLMHCQEYPIYVFLFWELRGFSPISTFTFLCLWAIYIFSGSVHIFPAAEYADRWWEYINRSPTHNFGDCGHWDCGRAIPFPIFGAGSLQCGGDLNFQISKTFWNNIIQISIRQIHFQDIYSQLWKVKNFCGNITPFKQKLIFE
jgi:hypothetical protein